MQKVFLPILIISLVILFGGVWQVQADEDCYYQPGACGQDTTKWCSETECSSCSQSPQRFANCDLVQSCECNLSQGMVCQYGACVAGTSVPSCPEGQICNPLAYGTFQEILGAITDFVFTVGMVLAPLMLIIAGFFFVTSAGDPKRIETAKRLALYALIGLAVLLLAKGLIKVLESILRVKGA